METKPVETDYDCLDFALFTNVSYLSYDGWEEDWDWEILNKETNTKIYELINELGYDDYFILKAHSIGCIIDGVENISEEITGGYSIGISSIGIKGCQDYRYGVFSLNIIT